MKYMGSKGRIAKHILPIILKNRKPDQYYVEPFVGGANMIDKVDGLKIGSDVNKYSIALLKAMQDGFQPPIFTREQVSDIKDNKDKYPDHIVGWAGFGCSYSGKFFGGYAGTVTTKTGSIRNYIQEAVNNCLQQSEFIRGVDFQCSSYLDIVIPENSIIYCDPPYKCTEGYKVKFNHDEFWQWCRYMSNAGHTVFISEYSAPEDFICIWEKQLSSSLSANGKSGGNKKSTERLFIYSPQQWQSDLNW